MSEPGAPGKEMAARLVMLGLVLVAMGTLAATAAALARVSVGPNAVRPRTWIVIRFRAPERTGRIGVIRRTDRLYLIGPEASGCLSRVNRALASVRRGAHVRITLRPRPAAGWCVGQFRGRIIRTESLICSRTCAGPLLPVPKTIARFSFRVRKPAASPGPGPTPNPSAGPTFAGIKTAELCSAGPTEMATSTRGYTVGRNAATDPSTPSDKIVYDIFYSSTSGTENFGSPLVTTGPGQTTYSGTLAGSGSASFVVRARDSAGREDSNRVQKLAVNTC